MTDSRQRFFFPDTDLRGEWVSLENTLTPIFGARQYPLEIQTLLGEALAATCLMTGTLKFKGRLSIQAQGKGDLALLLAEGTHHNTLRGLARWDGSVGDGRSPSLPELLGDEARMAITIHPEQGQSYQSLVPLASDDLAGCLTHYFDQSEQIPTRLWLAAGNGRAAGLLLQRLPEQNADKAHNDDQWHTLGALADTLKTEELLSLSAAELLHRLFHETPPQVPEAENVAFGCTCTRDKVEEMLTSLGKDTLQSLLDEKGEADIQCDFCKQTQHFDAVDLGALIKQLQH